MGRRDGREERDGGGRMKKREGERTGERTTRQPDGRKDDETAGREKRITVSGRAGEIWAGSLVARKWITCRQH